MPRNDYLYCVQVTYLTVTRMQMHHRIDNETFGVALSPNFSLNTSFMEKSSVMHLM